MRILSRYICLPRETLSVSEKRPSKFEIKTQQIYWNRLRNTNVAFWYIPCQRCFW